MATHPDTPPNPIMPQSPSERPSAPAPSEDPFEELPETYPSAPDEDYPDPELRLRLSWSDAAFYASKRCASSATTVAGRFASSVNQPARSLTSYRS